MDSNDEFNTIYEELKKESLKDQEKTLDIELEKKLYLSEKDINTINEFIEDPEFVENLNNLYSTFNRQNLINSKFYQKNKGLHYFRDFLSFRKIKFKSNNYPYEKNHFSKYFSSLNLIPEKNEIS